MHWSAYKGEGDISGVTVSQALPLTPAAGAVDHHMFALPAAVARAVLNTALYRSSLPKSLGAEADETIDAICRAALWQDGEGMVGIAWFWGHAIG